MVEPHSAGACIAPPRSLRDQREGANHPSNKGKFMTAIAPGKVRHAVFFWLRNPGSLADRDRLIAGLEGLRAIELIASLDIGIPADTEQRDVVDGSFAVSELMTFDSLADQAAYQDHPLHRKFVEECEGLWSEVKVFDSVDPA